VARVAAALGYRSASAFTQMFRRALGRTPSAYLGG
jgi:AraC-like DNA-binding protein